MKIIPFKNRAIDFSKSVQIYRNLTKKSVRYSIRQFGKVVGHSNRLYLENCHFIVNESGRQWVLKNHKKTVHAVIQGFLTASAEKEIKTHEQLPCIITYNPYKNDSFVCENLFIGELIKVNKAKFVFADEKEVRGIDIN